MRALLAASFVLLAVFSAVEAGGKLPVETIVIDTHKGPEKFRVEIAAGPAEQEQGLMYRKSMDANAGMIFPFGQPAFVMFWMKNTYIPLDIVFVRPDGTISSIAANAEPMSLKSIPSLEPVKAVIEINGGRARELGIGEGDLVHASMFMNQRK
jgi:uncharacterized protein